jgi:hypothetical protein
MLAEMAVMEAVAIPITLMKPGVEKLAVKAEEVVSVLMALMADLVRMKSLAKTGSKVVAREIRWGEL